METMETMENFVCDDSILINMLTNDDFMGIYKRGKYDFILNIFLVKYDARKAYLFEWSNYSNMSREKCEECEVSSFLKIISSLGLHYDLDPQSIPGYPRYFVSKEKLKNIPDDDEQIGQLLGFKDPGGNFYDYTQKRITLYIKEVITGVCIITEILSPLRNIHDTDVQEHAREKVDSFNKVMCQLNMPYHFIYEIEEKDGSIKRLEELKKMNLKYIDENKEYYIEYDLENSVLPEDAENNYIINIFKKCLSDKNLLSKYLPLFEYIYELYNDIENQDYYKKVNLINRYLIVIELSLKN